MTFQVSNSIAGLYLYCISFQKKNMSLIVLILSHAHFFWETKGAVLPWVVVQFKEMTTCAGDLELFGFFFGQKKQWRHESMNFEAVETETQMNMCWKTKLNLRLSFFTWKVVIRDCCRD